MDKQEPYMDWIPEHVTFRDHDDLIEYALIKVESNWALQGWDQPFAVGAIFQSQVPDTGYGALSVGVVPLPPLVVEDPDALLIFAKLVAQAIYEDEFDDSDFRRFLFQASIGSPDQDLETPRAWMRNVLEPGGQVVGWFAIVEGWDGDLPDNAAGLTSEQLRALPGVSEGRAFIFCSVNQYMASIVRTRREPEDEVSPVIRSTKVEDQIGMALGLLLASSLRMQIRMDNEG